MMKKILSVVLVALFYGCDDFLTVQPKSDILEKDLLLTEEGIQDALNGVYSEMVKTDNYGYSMTYYLPEMLAQSWEIDVQSGGTSLADREIMDYNHEYAKEVYGAVWTSIYKLIGYNNNIVNALESTDKSNFRHYNTYMGEALGIRAFLHFDLVRLFAPNLPEKPDARAIPYVKVWRPMVTPMSTVKEVYNQIFTDLRRSVRYLEEAQQDLIDEKDIFLQHPTLHFNLNAAYATMARIFWQNQQLDSAYVYAKKVIDSEQFRLVSRSDIATFIQGYVASTEAIWGLSATKDYYKTLASYFQADNAPLHVKPAVLERYASNYLKDAREGWFMEKQVTIAGKDENRILFRKFFNDSYYESNSWSVNGIVGVNMIRLPEMYLIAIEALLEKDPQQALAYYDRLMVSRGRIFEGESVGAVTMEEVRNERYREFFGEGYEWFNMKREKRQLWITSEKRYVEGTDKLYVLPLSDDEVEYRPDL